MIFRFEDFELDAERLELHYWDALLKADALVLRLLLILVRNYMGGTLADCSNVMLTAADSPCRAASLLGVCTNISMTNCMNPCT